MAITILDECILLFQMACVIFLFAYLFGKSRFYTAILEHRATLLAQIFFSIIFGLLSVYGMSSGISFYTATVNIRDFGPLVAGLACGPYIGLGAGIIGFIYRLSIGGTNVYAVAIGPLMAGIIGGLVYHYSNRELVSTRVAVIITLIAESLISAIAIVVRIVEGNSVGEVLTVTLNVALPMIIMTTIAVGIFCYILHNQISERHIQKEKLQLELEVESKRNLNTIINTIAYPVYVLDRDHRFVLVNDSLCNFMGSAREMILGKTHRDFYTGLDAERHWNWVETEFCDHIPREEEVAITQPGGRECTLISTSTGYTDTAGREFIVGVIQDITERKKMQEALAESEEWYRILFEHTGAATIIVNEDGTIDQANSEFAQLTGFSLLEIGKQIRFTQFVHPDDFEHVNKYHIERSIDPVSVPTGYTARIVDSKGIIKTLRAVVALIPGTKKSIASFVDISDQKKSEEALQQINRKLNLLSSVTRHDIINQLLILKGFLALLKKKTDNLDLLNYINSSDKAAMNIEHQIIFTRDYQDMGVKEPGWQNVNRTIIGAKGALAMGTVSVEMDRPDLEVFADPLFEKVFYNMIDNSLKYGGEQLSTIRISSHEENNTLVIRYTDDGAGITGEDHAHLFERGYGKHTGFGLFLSREILSITGISITETGTPGIGVQFTIRVPKGMYRFQNGVTG
jgi:PAS domain S-box-containing protein